MFFSSSLFGCFCCRLKRLLFNTIHTKCFSGWFLIILNAFFSFTLRKSNSFCFAVDRSSPQSCRTLVLYGFSLLQLFRFLVWFFAVGLRVHSFTLNVYVNSMRYWAMYRHSQHTRCENYFLFSIWLFLNFVCAENLYALLGMKCSLLFLLLLFHSNFTLFADSVAARNVASVVLCFFLALCLCL